MARGAFTAVDLSQLPVPDAVEQINYEIILDDEAADFQKRMDESGQPFTALLESDPAYKVMEAGAYRETLMRQRANEEVFAVMLAYAAGADLDQIGANYNVKRLTLVPADPTTVPPTEAVMESDTDFRHRIQLSFEGFSTAGPSGAYIFHGLGAAADVLDIGVDHPRFANYTPAPAIAEQLPDNVIILQAIYDAALENPRPGDVAVTVLSRQGDGTPDQGLLDTVYATLSAEDVRPLTDNVRVRAAEIIHYTIEADITVYPGPDGDVVLQAAIDAATKYAETQHRIGLDITLSGVYAALHQPGTQNVNLKQPMANIVIDGHQASYCTGITVKIVGEDE